MGYANMRGFLGPYHEDRYHLCAYRVRGKHPRGPMKLFHYRHSSLYNVIEQCFGVLKGLFTIMKLMPNYLIRKQIHIHVACCTMHNIIRMQLRNDIIVHHQANDLHVVDEESSGENQAGEHIHLHEDNAN
ncbi:unnamed protein product, partial [Prunus brigantina]